MTTIDNTGSGEAATHVVLQGEWVKWVALCDQLQSTRDDISKMLREAEADAEASVEGFTAMYRNLYDLKDVERKIARRIKRLGRAVFWRWEPPYLG